MMHHVPFAGLNNIINKIKIIQILKWFFKTIYLIALD